MTSKEALLYLALRELVERDTPKKPVILEYSIVCPNCNRDGCTIYNGYGDDFELNFCDSCGQRLDWSER